MHSARILKAPGLNIRSINPDDSITEYLEWLQDSSTTKYLEVRLDPPQTEDDLWASIHGEHISQDSMLFGIFHENQGRLIGTVRLSSVSQFHERAEIGILVGAKDTRRTGVASAAITEVTKYALGDLSLQTIYAGYYSGHSASRELFAKLGFKVVAVIPHYFRLEDGSYQDREIVCLRSGDV